jgi:hypothetical protein
MASQFHRNLLNQCPFLILLARKYPDLLEDAIRSALESAGDGTTCLQEPIEIYPFGIEGACEVVYGILDGIILRDEVYKPAEDVSHDPSREVLGPTGYVRY